MSKERERTLRRTQSLSPFGVGAIIDRLGESFVAEDISRWKGTSHSLKTPRIARHFGVDDLRTPPPSEAKGSSMPFYRFPARLFCGNCRRMTRWSTRDEEPGIPAKCKNCRQSPQLVPMRFVMVCGNGHLADVPWGFWAHSGQGNRDQRQCGFDESRLSFIQVKGVGGGLESVAVSCACGASRSLKDLPAPDAMARLRVSCPGTQPWQWHDKAVQCSATPVVLQRGASSVYYSKTASALDIPPDSEWMEYDGPAVRIRNNDNFRLLETRPDHPLRDGLLDMIAEDEGVDIQMVVQVLESKLGEVLPDDVEGASIEELEWVALTRPATSHDPRDRFISTPTDWPGTGHEVLTGTARALGECLTQVVLVHRLREIRVLQGFHRHTLDQLVAPDLGQGVRFLPALEVYGEGIFIRLDEQRLRDWEASGEVRKRCDVLRRRLAGSMHSRWLEAEPTPRLILLHTLAHLMMRAVAFEAGYSSSSLRERIYAGTGGDARAGILIYTAAGDSEGTMGGLARLGRSNRLVPILASAITEADWCSLDPVCRESMGQGVDGLSLAACHACALASETSCVMGNVLLDRLLLVDPGFGFLAESLAAILEMQAEETGSALAT